MASGNDRTPDHSDDRAATAESPEQESSAGRFRAEDQVTVDVTDGRDDVVVHVRGEVDMASGPVLWEHLAEVIPRTEHLVLDLRDTEFIDSTGLAVFVRALRRLRNNGGDLILRSPTASTRKVLEITGLDKVFTIEG